MPAALRLFFARHPVVRDAVLWALPAIVLGAVLRLLLLHYLPYAYWGSDSRSYYSFTHLLLERGYVSLDEKRRYLYPLLMLPISVLPGSPLRWLAWLQHGLGLATILPLAYLVRKSFVHWRLWVVPVTVAFSGMPLVLWYEHELLGETLFFAMLVWTIAGWAAWVGEAQLERARRLFWWFFVPFALFLLTKPAGRFYWPGVLVGLVAVCAWRKLDWRRWTALGVLFAITLTVGSKKQAAWLLYSAVFPLTQLGTPLHADYKAQIRDKVEVAQRDFAIFYDRDEDAFNFLEVPGKHPDRPLWAALDKDVKKKSAVYMALAKEGIFARPDLALNLGLQKLLGSANLSAFKRDRFLSSYTAERYEHLYDASAKRDDGVARRILALPRGPLPDYAEISARLAPHPGGFAERTVRAWVEGYLSVCDLIVMPRDREGEVQAIIPPKFTPLGWWLLAGIVLSLLPRYRPVLGVWAIAACLYLVGVFCVSHMNPRYFAPAWPVFIPLLAVPADALLALLRRGAAR